MGTFMPGDPFENCRTKLKRADFHIKHIEHNVRERAKELYGLITFDDPQTGERVVQKTFPNDTFLALSIIAGEAIHQMRSTLDHVVWQLPCERGRQKHRRAEFPIFWEASKYKNEGRPKIDHLCAPAIAVIDRRQPIKPEPERLAEPLYILQELWNREKHRVLNFASIELQAFKEGYKYPDGRYSETPILNPPVQPQNGTELGRFRRPADLTTDVKVYEIALVSPLRFEDAGAATGHEVTELLTRLLRVVEGITNDLIATVP
jgi:hypothetical protein